MAAQEMGVVDEVPLLRHLPHRLRPLLKDRGVVVVVPREVVKEIVEAVEGCMAVTLVAIMAMMTTMDVVKKEDTVDFLAEKESEAIVLARVIVVVGVGSPLPIVGALLLSPVLAPPFPLARVGEERVR